MLRPIHVVRVEASGPGSEVIELEVKDGQTVFRAANAAGHEWPTRCGGASTCTLCTMVVVDGAEHLSRPSDEELLLCGPIARRLGVDVANLRMACAAKVRGPVVVAPRYPLGAPVDEPTEVFG